MYLSATNGVFSIVISFCHCLLTSGNKQEVDLHASPTQLRLTSLLLRNGKPGHHMVIAVMLRSGVALNSSDLDFKSTISKNADCTSLVPKPKLEVTELKKHHNFFIPANTIAEVEASNVTVTVKLDFQCTDDLEMLYLCTTVKFASAAPYRDPTQQNNCVCYRLNRVYCLPDLSMEEFAIVSTEPGIIFQEESKVVFKFGFKSDLPISATGKDNFIFVFSASNDYMGKYNHPNMNVRGIAFRQPNPTSIALKADEIAYVEGHVQINVTRSCYDAEFLCVTVKRANNSAFEERKTPEAQRNNVRCTHLHIACFPFQFSFIINEDWDESYMYGNTTSYQDLEKKLIDGTDAKLNGSVTDFVRATISSMRKSATGKVKVLIYTWVDTRPYNSETTRNISITITRLLKTESIEYEIVEFNECFGIDLCSAHATCIELRDGFECRCNEGLSTTDNGRTCSRSKDETWHLKGYVLLMDEWKSVFDSPVSDLSRSVRSEFPRVVDFALDKSRTWRTFKQKCNVLGMTKTDDGSIQIYFLIRFRGPRLPEQPTQLLRDNLQKSRYNTSLPYNNIYRVEALTEEKPKQCIPPIDKTATFFDKSGGAVMESAVVIGVVIASMAALVASFCAIVYWRKNNRGVTQLKEVAEENEDEKFSLPPQDPRFLTVGPPQHSEPVMLPYTGTETETLEPDNPEALTWISKV